MEMLKSQRDNKRALVLAFLHIGVGLEDEFK
jgi:hypothetical protein